MSWRDHARPIIHRALEATKGKPEKDIRRALREAYPYGVRRHWPYKIWLDEIARQRGTKPPLGSPADAANPDQLALPIEAAKPATPGD